MPLFGPPNIEKLKAKGAVTSLINALNYDKDPQIRLKAAEALAEIGHLQAVEPLIATLKDSDMKVRAMAAGALGKFGDMHTIEPLVAALKDSALVASAAVEALAQVGNPAVELLIATLKDRSIAEAVWKAAAEALTRIGGNHATELLLAALEDSDKDVRRRAAETLDKIGWKPLNNTQRAFYSVAKRQWNEVAELGVDAIDPLILTLKDTEASIRAHTVEVLGKIGDARAVELLIEALKDSEVWIQPAEALGNIGVLVGRLAHGAG